MNQYESIVTSGVDYIYSFRGSSQLESVKEEERIAEAYEHFLQSNSATFEALYYKADLFEGHRYVGESLTKVLRKVQGIYDVN